MRWMFLNVRLCVLAHRRGDTQMAVYIVTALLQSQSHRARRLAIPWTSSEVRGHAIRTTAVVAIALRWGEGNTMAEIKTHVQIPRSVWAPLSGAQAVADINPGERINITVRLRRRVPPQQLTAAVQAMSAVPPGQQRHLSRTDFADTYDADPGDIDQIKAFASQNGLKVGFLNPFLYAHPTVCHDITTGSNIDYNAAVGWDPCTGLGSPDGTKLLQALGGH
jgi:hypothetical protein